MEPPTVITTSLKSLATGLFLVLMVASLLELSLLALRPLLTRVGKKIGLNGGIELVLGLVLGILLAGWLSIDVFSMTFGVNSNWLGIFLTGVVIGQGGTWVLKVLPRIKLLSSVAPLQSKLPYIEDEPEETEEKMKESEETK